MQNSFKSKTLVSALAILSVISGLFSYFVLTPAANNLDQNFSYSADLDSVDNLFESSRGQFSGAQASRSKFSYETTSTDGNILLIKNILDVKTLSGTEIVNIERDYAIDGQTKKHTIYEGIKQREGYLFAPPGLVKGQSFSYWHVNYDKELSMAYESEESILGLQVYKYSTNFQVDQTNELSSLPNVPEKYGVRLDVNLSIWVEPTTGRLVNFQDSAKADYYDITTGSFVEPWNRFSNKFTQPSIEQQVTIARNNKDNIRLLSFILPISLFMFAALLMSAFWIDFSVLHKRLPITILVIGLLITLLTVNGVARSQDIERKIEFDRRTGSFESAIEQRMQFYDDALHAARGFLNGSEDVTSDEWREFTTDINLQNRLPGIQGVGLSLFVGAKENVPAFETQYQEELEINDFSVRPVLEENNHSVIYLEPLDERNKEAIGFNMYSEATRRTAMDKAVSSGESTLSGAVTLVQEIDDDVQKGFLLYLPQYRKNSLTSTPELRNENLEGFIYSPFRAGDFIDSVINDTDRNLRFNIYSKQKNPNNLIYTNIDEDLSKLNPVRNSSITFYGTTWHIDYFETPTPFAFLSDGQTNMVLLFGLAITLLSGGVAFLQTNAGRRAEALAQEKTKQLQQSEANAKLIAVDSIEASKKLKRSQHDLLRQNDLLQKSKKAVVNILEDLEKERQKLSETIAKDEALIKGIGDGLVATDKDEKIILVNDQFENLTGFTSKEVIGKPLTEVLVLIDESGKEMKKSDRPIGKITSDNSPQAISTSDSVYYRKKDGSKFPVSITIAPVLKNGKADGFIEIFRDTTHEKAIDRAKSEFVSLASHQLRTPLTAINWYSDMLTAGDAGKLNEEQAKYVQEVRAGSQRMVDLVNALLNVSRIDLGTFMIEPTETDLIDLCKKIVQDSEPKIFERKQDFEEKYPKDLPKMNIDPQLMRMVIENLVSNAIKYTPEKGKINLTVAKDDKDVTISVSDTGYGIPKAQQEKIFSKMFRADNVVAHDTEGTGLGLYIAKSVIEAAGGDIWFESEENKGTTFSVKIPLSGMTEHKGSRRLDS